MSRPAEASATERDLPRTLVIGCGALARELLHLVRAGGFEHVEITCLPAKLHNRPAGIPERLRAKIREARGRYDRIVVAYADCGTGGVLDAVLAEEGVERLPGAHCYELYAGHARFAELAEEEPGTFYLTDYLARHFERLVVVGLGLDRHPELLPVYFKNYRRLVFLAQTDDPTLVEAARRAADRLGLEFRLERTGFAPFATEFERVVAGSLAGVGDAGGAGAAGTGAGADVGVAGAGAVTSLARGAA